MNPILRGVQSDIRKSWASQEETPNSFFVGGAEPCEPQATPMLNIELESLHTEIDNLANTVQQMFNHLDFVTRDEEMSESADESAIATSLFAVSGAVRQLQHMRRDIVALNSAIQNRTTLLDI